MAWAPAPATETLAVQRRSLPPGGNPHRRLLCVKRVNAEPGLAGPGHACSCPEGAASKWPAGHATPPPDGTVLARELGSECHTRDMYIENLYMYRDAVSCCGLVVPLLTESELTNRNGTNEGKNPSTTDTTRAVQRNGD